MKKENSIISNWGGRVPVGECFDTEKTSDSWDKMEAENEKLYWQLMNGRAYLMEVQADDLNVEDALESFGFGKNGLK